MVGEYGLEVQWTWLLIGAGLGFLFSAVVVTVVEWLLPRYFDEEVDQ